MDSCHTSRFRIVRLTREDLIIQCKRDDYEVWGAPDMTLPQYQAEEKFQRMTAHSQRGLTVWALVECGPSHSETKFGTVADMGDDDIIPGNTAIVSHCESHTFDCLLRKLHGEIVRGFSYHINAVYTLPSYRKQGLARFFLKEVSRQLARQENAIASVLYSDIGPTFYERLGWQVHRSTIAVVDVVACSLEAPLLEEESFQTAALFLDGALDKLLANEHAKLEASLRSSVDVQDREVFVALPTRECLEWQFCSGVFHAYVRQNECTPKQCGVHVGDHGFVLWSHDLRESTLYITYSTLPIDRADVTWIALRHAIEEAHRFGLRYVKMWDPTTQLPVLADRQVAQHVSSVTYEERVDSLSSLMVFKHVRDDPNSDVRPKWLHNEKFAWV